uniref:Sulfotransferase domain-containing protein n=1 Tax=Alexandrium catenella TaxID=2925 RepID=A0A7S1SF14_ALECA|mmetsp:Transcript_987/g.2626  ORF Transcript_987/g.2626 Transcript_987/m.2626 type:complete len:362 (+) Transcript_987:81-1166(+)
MFSTLHAVCVALVLGGGSAVLFRSPSAHEEETDKPTDYSMEDAIRFLWYGYDMGHELQGVLARAPRVRHYVRKFNVSDYEVSPGESSPKLVVLGPKDSGVSLLMETLELNYLPQMKQACGWEDIWIDKDRPWTGHLFCRLFPHGLRDSDSPALEGADSLYSVLDRQGTDPKDTVAIFVVKSPLVTLQSWNTAIRERTACIKRSAREWDTACTGEDIAWSQDGQRNREYTEEMASTMDLYNRYMRMYQQVKKDGRFLKAMFVTYEDFVMDPADTMLQIASTMKWKVMGDIEVLEGMSANGFPAAGRPLMVEQMRGRLWLGWTPKETRAIWCSGLDLNAFEDLTENSYRLDEFPYVQYGFDCK